MSLISGDDGKPRPDAGRARSARNAAMRKRKNPAENRASIIRRLDVDYLGYLRPLDKSGDVWLYEIVSWPR